MRLATNLKALIRLTRLNRPIGIWLLFWPCVWGIMAATPRAVGPDLRVILLFGVGALIMRSAGCIINDIWDRKLDKQVARTAQRPLASGHVSLLQASVLTLILLLCGLIILIQFNNLTILLGFIALGLVVAYPAMKRITWWPQAFLGVTFNWGILMGWVAVADHGRGGIDIPALVLYFGALFWTIGYDTIYAQQDIEDDLKVGIKSTAIKFAAAPKKFVALCYALAWLLWWCAGIFAGWRWWYFIGLLLPAAQLVWQLAYWKPHDAVSSLKIFKSNFWLGLLMVVALLFAKPL